MRATVPDALAERSVDTVNPRALETFVNRELRPLVSKARAALNYQNIESATGDSDGTIAYITLWTSPDMPANATWHVEADITGIGIATAERATWKFVRSYTSAAGVITVSPIGMVYQYTTAVGMDAYLGATLTGAAVYASDATLGAMRWTVVVKTTEVLVET